MEIVQIKKERKRDYLFENVAEVCCMDIKDLTKSSRGVLNKAVGELRDINPSLDELKGRVSVYKEIYSGCPVTPTALVKHWPLLKEKNNKDSGIRKSMEAYDTFKSSI